MMTRFRKTVKSIADNVNIWIERKIAQAVNLVPMETDSLPHQSYSYTKKIRVKKTIDCPHWYRDRIGETFDVEAESPDYYWVRDVKDDWLIGILKKDAEVI
jgi:hypothetical protein